MNLKAKTIMTNPFYHYTTCTTLYTYGLRDHVIGNIMCALSMKRRFHTNTNIFSLWVSHLSCMIRRQNETMKLYVEVWKVFSFRLLHQVEEKKIENNKQLVKTLKVLTFLFNNSNRRIYC